MKDWLTNWSSIICLFTWPGGHGPPDGTDAEDTERCPICLGVLSGDELAMPDSCCHVFCLSCLLTWAEVKLHADRNMPWTVFWVPLEYLRFFFIFFKMHIPLTHTLVWMCCQLQMTPSCPVDRRPFSNVYRWDGNRGCVLVSLVSFFFFFSHAML